MRSAAEIAEEKKRLPLVDFFVRLVKEKPLGAFGGAVTLLFLLTAVFSDFLAPYGLNEVGVAPPLAPPSMDHLLGSDQLGRDTLSRIIYGARISVVVSLSATTLATLISVLLGGISGFFGGKFDLVVQRFVDGWMCFPGLIVLIIMVTLFGPGMWQIILIMGVMTGIGGSRIVRSAVIGIKENVYVEASRTVGCSTARILGRHILPNIMAVVITLYTTRVPLMILQEASLSFLGLGIPPPDPTWGGMLSVDGRRFMLRSPWLAFWPGFALSMVVYSVSMFGDATRDLLDPKLRGGVGRYSGVDSKLRKIRKENRENAGAA